MPFFNLRDIKIHCAVEGKGPPVVFVAGMTLGAHVWHKVIKGLGSNFTSIAVDMRGSGKSDAPRGPYTIELLAQDVSELIEALPVNNPVLVGHSMGGFVALHIAAEKRLSLKGLVLISSSPCGDPKTFGITPVAEKALSRTSGTLKQIFKGTLEIGLGKKIKRQQPKSIDEFVTSHLKNPPRGFGFEGQKAAALRFDGNNLLKNIDCPTLVIHGNDDQFILKARAADLHAGIKRSKLIELDDVGHFPQIEAPDVVAKAIVDLAEMSVRYGMR